MPTAPPPFDLTLARDAFGTAGRLHAEATRRAAESLTPEHYERLRQADAEYVAAVNEDRVRDAIDADDRFHRIILEVADDPDLTVGVDLLLPRLRRMDLWLFTRKALDGRKSTHPETIAALERGDVKDAATLIERSYTDAGEELATQIERASS